jgi:hypothetical protein
MKNKRDGWKHGLMMAALLSSTSPVFFQTPANAATRVFNVQNFGATGNGVTDDTDSINNCIAAAELFSNSTVFFPSGSYLFSKTLNVTGNGTSIVGHFATLISANQSSSLQLQGMNETVQAMSFSSKAPQNIGIFVLNANGFKIIGNTFNTNVLVDVLVQNSSHGQIQTNTMLLGNSATAMNISASNLITLQRNSVTSSSSSTASIDVFNCTNVTLDTNFLDGGSRVMDLQNNLTVALLSNHIANFTQFGVFSSGDAGLTVRNNQFLSSSSTGTDLSLNSDSNVTVSANKMFGSGTTGVQSIGGNHIQILENSIQNLQTYGVQLSANTNTSARANTIRNVGTAISAGSETNLTVIGNQIAQCQHSGISTQSCSGTETIANNEIRDCGAEVTNPAAVIYVNSPSATSIPITGNSYTGNTTNLQNFIRCVQSEPPARVSGNVTNTGLPNHIGP